MFFLENQDLTNKKAIIRVDLNVPLDENKNVTDTTRIEACIETIEKVIELGGSCVLLSHLGRPKGKDKNLSLKLIVETVSTVLKKPVLFHEDCIGSDAERQFRYCHRGKLFLWKT